jgi:hypothetical protein
VLHEGIGAYSYDKYTKYWKSYDTKGKLRFVRSPKLLGATHLIYTTK